MPFARVKGYHSKTLAYSIWHIFRIEDIVAHEMIAEGAQILFREKFLEKTESPVITTGNELEGEEIVEFSKKLNVWGLYLYARIDFVQWEAAFVFHYNRLEGTKMIRAAKKTDFDSVKNITQTTIWSVYPKYYPRGAVQFFSDYHSDERIKADIDAGDVYLIEADGTEIGTVTIADNEINRLFVLPEFQHRGYGKKLIDFAEEMIRGEYDHVILDASLPAKQMYLKRGYAASKYNMIETESGDYLCFDIMEKRI